ncbi:MAG TPA: hypothetical protein VHP33_35740 [Polyangiaceae bacterium]|nr:hypothetical protein [Polyangiaceae bacterium]
MPFNEPAKLVAVLLALGWLGACGGGGEDSPSTGAAGTPGSAGTSTGSAGGGAANTPVGGAATTMAGSATQPSGGGGSAAGGSATAGSASAGAAPVAGTSSGGSAGTGNSGMLTATPAEALWTGVRYYTGSTPANRTSGPAQGPEKIITVHNGGSTPVELAISITGADAARFKLTAPAEPKLTVAAGADGEVRLRLTTDNAMLGAAPAQAAGATVFNAAVELSQGAQKLSIRNYALVLTYVELEPTFGQILKAFPAWTTKLPSWLPDNANPNPGSPLPGVVAATDEVAAPSFERLDATKPVTFRPIARFSPPGQVPFGWYEPGKIAGRTTAGTMAEQADTHTNSKSRMLEPPLASGSISFEPSVAKFGIWMSPAGVGLLTSDDANGFDGQHRVRSWTLRDAAGAAIPGSYLVGGEEAANGDYQDYVFVLTNVKPSP